MFAEVAAKNVGGVFLRHSVESLLLIIILYFLCCDDYLLTIEIYNFVQAENVLNVKTVSVVYDVSDKAVDFRVSYASYHVYRSQR